MDVKHLKAAAQLAEMEHKADPKNVGKKDAFEKAQGEYEQAAEAQAPAETAEPISDTISQEDRNEQRRILNVFEKGGAITIEELEEMLKAKKADKKATEDKAKADKKAADDQAKANQKAADDKAKADKKAADEQAEADKAKAEEEAEAAKKNESQS